MALSPNMNVMIKAAEKAGRSLARDFGEVEQLQVSQKGPGDFVSAADLRAEEIIFEELSKARPDFGFLMEERGEAGKKDSDFRWIVDPLDGTSNFLHGIPHWCVSIGLEEKGEIVAGIVHDPVKDETFRAEKGQGAFMRNKRLRVSGRTSLDGAMIACGQPKPNDRTTFMAQYDAIMKATSCGVRRYGAAALDLSYVAAGRYEGFWERGLQAWDMAAGYIIIKEAGGLVTDIEGTNTNPVYERNILAGNSNLHGELKKILNGAKQEKDAA